MRTISLDAAAIRLHAWTGGSSAANFLDCRPIERDLRTVLFRQQCAEYRAFWHDLPRDVCRIFYRRAAADAHATMRETLGEPFRNPYLSNSYRKARAAALALGQVPPEPRGRFSADHEDWCELADAFGATYEPTHKADVAYLAFYARLMTREARAFIGVED
ncbi:MAG: hypothetical protein KGL39_09560 [Patescibacteria group bacterium]|nr:hypothetical protein [Patescibacteria group bacterium]